jgi:dynein heavy chain, axonemal
VVPFLSKIDPKGKNVEMWMNEVEAGMRDAFKKTLWDSILNYVEIPRTDWIQKWPGQAVLNGSQLHWTREIEEGIMNEGRIGVKKCLDKQLQQLQDMVRLVRGKLERLVRMTMGALTVIDVHARDVTKTLVEAGVSSVNDFEWISQMRYYWRGDQSLSGDMFVTMVSSERPYGYEYLGNSLRLVITPLTDKCYMTLMGALQMELGGAPAGPAGTGKTESVKDLAKALAKQCVVFNCSGKRCCVLHRSCPWSVIVCL